MTRPFVPQSVLDAAHARSAARASGDFNRADQLRGEIEAAGWSVVDSGSDFRLQPAHPADLEADGIVRYGRSTAVPDRHGEADTAEVTILIVATEHPDELQRAVGGVLAHGPPGVQLVVVADGPSPDQDVRLGGQPEGVEVVRTSQRLGAAAALNIGMRRAIGRVVVLVDPSVEATGDFVTPLLEALEDEDVVVVGVLGFSSADLLRYEPVASGPAATIEGSVMAFRRADGVAIGPVDEAFRYQRHLDTWWSLALRDGGSDGLPRRAVVIPGLPLLRHTSAGEATVSAADRDRLSKRNYYRVLDAFRDRPDLAVAGD